MLLNRQRIAVTSMKLSTGTRSSVISNNCGTGLYYFILAFTYLAIFLTELPHFCMVLITLYELLEVLQLRIFSVVEYNPNTMSMKISIHFMFCKGSLKKLHELDGWDMLGGFFLT